MRGKKMKIFTSAMLFCSLTLGIAAPIRENRHQNKNFDNNNILEKKKEDINESNINEIIIGEKIINDSGSSKINENWKKLIEEKIEEMKLHESRLNEKNKELSSKLIKDEKKIEELSSLNQKTLEENKTSIDEKKDEINSKKNKEKKLINYKEELEKNEIQLTNQNFVLDNDNKWLNEKIKEIEEIKTEEDKNKNLIYQKLKTEEKLKELESEKEKLEENWNKFSAEKKIEEDHLETKIKELEKNIEDAEGKNSYLKYEIWCKDKKRVEGMKKIKDLVVEILNELKEDEDETDSSLLNSSLNENNQTQIAPIIKSQAIDYDSNQNSFNKKNILMTFNFYVYTLIGSGIITILKLNL
jgi:hypothetical protein